MSKKSSSTPSKLEKRGVTSRRKPFITVDWASSACLQWSRLVFPLLPPEPLTWLELGSFEGGTALWLVEHLLIHPASKIHCVDKWEVLTKSDGFIDEGYDYESVFDENTRHVEQIIKRKGYTRDVLPTFEPGQFDACYIDASREYDDVLRDARMVLPLMKSGGVIIFGDYDRSPPGGVRRAVRELIGEWCIKVEGKVSAHVVHTRSQAIFQAV